MSMSNSSGAGPSDDYLLKLFIADVKGKLRSLLMQDIQPIIDEAVSDAISSLKPEIESYFNEVARQFSAVVVTHQKQNNNG